MPKKGSVMSKNFISPSKYIQGSGEMNNVGQYAKKLGEKSLLQTLPLSQLDFGFGDRAAERYFAFDVKEKRQPYRLDNWKTIIPEPHFFILDDLACRKILLYSPNAGLLVRDTPQQRWLQWADTNYASLRDTGFDVTIDGALDG